MIQRLDAKNYGCLRDVNIASLTPLHAFIGPNDSGKSTILRAVRVLSAFASGAPTGPSNPFEMQLDWDRTSQPRVELRAVTPLGAYNVRIQAGQPPVTGITENPGQLELDEAPREWGAPERPPSARAKAVLSHLSGARLLRLDPDVLKLPGALIPEGNPIDFSSERGGGLAGVYDALQNRYDDTYESIRKQVSELFPAVKRIALRNTADSKKAIYVELHDGRSVPADRVSEGLLYYLAYAAAVRLEPTSFLLVEEPENGLHPARIADVLRVLRAISETGTQVLIATHSPLVVNELQGREVTVVTRKPELGTQTILLSETPSFVERSKVYATGELWVSYANGEDEKPLLKGAAGG